MTASGTSDIVNKGGFDLWFETPGITDGCSIDIVSNVTITSGSVPSNIIAKISRVGSVYSVQICADDIVYEIFDTDVVSPKKVRWFMHNEFISCYVNENWIHTFYFTNVIYPEYEDFVISIYSEGESVTITNVKLVELYDWREAIYVDLDSAASNAVSSVIQQRPVEMRPTYLGEMRFQYSADEKRDVVNLYQKLIVSAQKDQNPNAVISDAIVYGSEVEVITSETTASNHGFITRIIRVPELDTGAHRAAKELMKIAEQQSIMHTIILRSDIRIEEGDILYCTYILSGTNKTISISCIVETITVNMSNGVFSMTITARNYEN